MEIKTQFEYRGKTYKVTYAYGTPQIETDQKMLDGVHSFCFYKANLDVQ